ncbi:hypothetical protein QYE76_006650 [Lolium multiflorum]|uniref:Uncharacterized protein n=1 Tax=Lolium multiflorum TaxID=4521 RepID=A0AAD8RW19_LOLMU|nr:hypothetical protein QYE76_006650 [Lolium multiflorum]
MQGRHFRNRLPRVKHLRGRLPPSLDSGEDGGEEGGYQENPEALPPKKPPAGPKNPAGGLELGQFREVHHPEPDGSPAPASKKRSANHFPLQTEETSSGDVEEVPSVTLDLATSTFAAAQVADLSKSAEKPIVTTSAVPPPLGEGCDLSSLLTFDPESIEPTSSKASGEPGLSTVHGPLQRLKDLLSSSTETLIDNSEEVKGILEDVQPHLPMTLQVKLWPAVTLSVFKSRVQSARQRITIRHSQLPLRADIADKCRRLNEKKAALDAKTDTSANRAELETLRKELESLEERVRMTKQLIQDKEALIARSEDEAKGLTPI